MKTGLSQTVRLGQELKINPRLYQAMDMLYMPLLDLQQHLKQELMVNPFLELAEEVDDTEPGAAEDLPGEAVAEPTDETDVDAADDAEAPVAEIVEPDTSVPDLADALTTPDEAPTTPADDFERWDEILQDGFEPEGGVAEEADERERFEFTPVAQTGLTEFLREQLELLDLTPRELLLAEEFVGNISDDGYLTATLDEIRDGINDVVLQAAARGGRDADDVPLYSAEDVAQIGRAHV